MKKYFLTGLMEIMLFAGLLMTAPETLAQNQSSDSLDVKSIVMQQIEEAKKRNAEQIELKTKPVPVMHVKLNQPHSADTLMGIPNEYLYKAGIMILGFTGILVWLHFRKNKREKILYNNKLKQNIKLMREEKFIKDIDDPRLKDIRTKLVLTSVVLNEEKKINAAARKSRIGKEEILLASRIRTHDLQYNKQRSFA